MKPWVTADFWDRHFSRHDLRRGFVFSYRLPAKVGYVFLSGLAVLDPEDARSLGELNAEARRDGLDDALLSAEFVILGQSVFAENRSVVATTDQWSGLLTPGEGVADPKGPFHAPHHLDILAAGADKMFFDPEAFLCLVDTIREEQDQRAYLREVYRPGFLERFYDEVCPDDDDDDDCQNS